MVFIIIGLFIFILCFVFLRMRANKNTNKLIQQSRCGQHDIEDAIDDYISISLVDGSRITNAYSDTIIRYNTSDK
ncbi:hypothetical protein GCM10025767_16580 [Thalassotalea piscium]|uniref:Uncharacterized protein n=1 Tax=Thalassotalea piscium TaxID=1230533 RepID=A0A7X0NH37_9GAMM|nr:hypothetical protein [Thalassotalea piscium]